MASSSRIIRPGIDHGRRGVLTALGGIGVAAGLRHAVQADTVFPFGGCVDEVFADAFEAPLSSCVLIPSETQGPYPLLSALGNEALYRRDIGEGRPGLPLSYRFKLVNVNAGCAPIPDAAVYIWQCDRDGIYSGYSQPGANTVGQTFCRGIQFTDCQGKVRFNAMYPGWYAGRITHLHFQVYLSVTGTATRTSQLAFPQAVTQAVYATALYPRGQNTSVTSFAQDNVFSDGVEYQMATMHGDAVNGYIAYLTIGIAV